MTEIEKITKRKLSDDVKLRLLDMIENGDYAEGDMLPSERELMTRFGIGRPAIREALQYLHNAGLILVSHGHRSTVQKPTAKDVLAQIDTVAKHLLSTSTDSLEQLKDARLFFEIGMVRKATELANTEDIKMLESAINRQHRYLKKNPEQFVKADMDFHIGIAQITGNAIFEASSRAILSWLETFHTKALHWQGNEHITLEEHAEILDCIRSKNKNAAANAMSNHLNRARGAYRR